jgi:hypothetical protein
MDFGESYLALEEGMIPDYIKNKDYIKILVAEVYLLLEPYKDQSPVAINDFALWLHGFNDEEVYTYLYKKNGFELPSIDLFATIDECAIELLRLFEPIINKGRLIKVRIFNYRAENVKEISYQSGFVGRQQLFDESSVLVMKIIDIDVVPFYCLEWLSPITSADKTFINKKLHAIPEANKMCVMQ